MSAYNPPIHNVPIFDSLLFSETNSDTLNIDIADKRYLRWPVAQGNETLQGISVNGTATFNSTSTFNQPITFQDGKVQNSAFTGGSAGTYTNPNMTIDANGKISAISSGSTPNLSQVLVAGNSAGSTSINMNNNAITGVNNLTLQTGSITFPDGKVQNSAFTGATAGTYTNTNMTIDANGKISAISSGSGGSTPTLSQVLVAGNSAGSTSINMNNNNITNAGIVSTLTNANPFVMGGVNPQVAVCARGIAGSTTTPIYMETIAVQITGAASSIDIQVNLANNYQNSINYMVFPSVYYGFTGSSGTYNAQNTANALNNSIIYNRNSSNFRFYCSKSTGNNVNIYLTFLVIYNSTGTNYPASY